MSLGNSAESIEVIGHFVVECDQRGWWVAYCTDCSAKGSSPTREDLLKWVDIHGPCDPDPYYDDHDGLYG